MLLLLFSVSTNHTNSFGSSKMSRNGITFAMVFREELFADKVRKLA